MNPLLYTDILQHNLEQFRTRPCLHIKRNNQWLTWTYEDVRRDLNRLVSFLKQNGYSAGSHGMVIGENTPEWIISYHALFLAGGCTLPVDPNLPENEIREILRQTAPKVIFCSPGFYSFFESLRTKGELQCRILTLPSEEKPTNNDYAEALKQGNSNTDAFSLPFSPNDPLAILFTSGTTGKAKGAVLLQRNFVTASQSGIPRMKIKPEHVFAAVLPLHHVFGFAACVAAPLGAGCCTVCVPVIKGPLIVEALKEQQVSVLPAVPQMLELFYTNIEKRVAEKGPLVKNVFGLLKTASALLGPLFGTTFQRKLFSSVHAGFGGRLDLIVSGGASIRKKYFTGFRCMGFRIVEGYGLTETFGPITICPAEQARLGSVGPVLAGNEMRIDSPDKEGIGEVCFRGETVFGGYFNNPDATQKVFDKEGWFHTGDLGRLDKDGFLYLTGRMKDVIILPSGKNVYPDELEEFYLTCPDLEEIVILGLPTEAGESVVALAVPSQAMRKLFSPEEASERLMQSLLNMGRHLPSYKKMAECRVTFSPLPRTTTRKIKKNEAKTLYLSLKENKVITIVSSQFTVKESEQMASPAFRTISGLLKSLIPKEGATPLTVRSHLEFDLRLDSLKRLELLSLLEKEMGRSISEESLSRLETVGEVLLLMTTDLKETSPFPDESAEPIRSYPENSSLLFRLIPFLIHKISRLCWNLKAAGMEQLPQGMPLIFAANHESLIDIAWIVCHLPWSLRRKTFTLGKQELLKNPIARFLLTRFNLVPLKRESDFGVTLQTSLALLKQGHSLALFPEGTRTRTGEMGPFKAGIGKLMMESGVQVVPIHIKKSFSIWPADQLLPKFLFARRFKPEIIFGKPVSLNEFGGTTKPGLTPDLISQTLRQHIHNMT